MEGKENGGFSASQVFKRTKGYVLNENVLIGTGYMLALGRQVLLLKDKRIERLPTDISNLIHRSYDYASFPFSMTKELTQ